MTTRARHRPTGADAHRIPSTPKGHHGGLPPRWAAAVVALAVLAMAGCGTRPRVSPQSSTAQTPGDNGFLAGPPVQLYSATQRTSPKPVIGELLDGSRFDLTSLRGMVVVINWWGSWCEPCRRETPHLVQAYNATRELGVEFVGVDVRDTRDAATSFTADYRVPYRSLFDPTGRVALAFMQVSPAVVPTTVILDRSGRVAVAVRKVVGDGELQPVIRRVAAEPAPAGSG